MITLSQLQQSCPCFQVGDIAYFKAGPPKYDKKTWLTEGKFWLKLANEQWFQPLAKEQLQGIPISQDYSTLVAGICVDVLKNAFFQARHEHIKPDWLERLPLELRHFLDCQWLTIETDAYAIIPHTMHTGFGFVILEGGLVERVTRALGLERLANVRQLAFLTSPTVSNGVVNEYPLSFDHSRYLHSLEVYAIATLIGLRCNLTPEELILLQVAALSHDVLTPAGGDVTKLIDSAAFDEDANYHEIFKWPGWLMLRNRYGLCEEKLTQTILGEGLLGAILDAADKLAYTARDSWEFLRRNHPRGFARKMFAEYEQIRSILRANPYPCSLWENTQRLGGKLVFTNENRLTNFIRLRALMFKILYANASARFVEAGFVAAVIKILHNDGVLTREALLSMEDMELFGMLNKATGDYGTFCPFHVISQTNAQVKTFSTRQEALDFERRIAKVEPQTMTQFEQAPPPRSKIPGYV